MSTITIDRAKLEQALEALEGNTTNPAIDPEQAAIEDQAIATLEQALAGQTVQEPEIDGATMAGMDASIGHLSALVDELRLLLGCAMANAKMLHNAAKPDDGPDMDAIIPAIVFRNFVDQDAALRYAIRDSAHDGMLIPTQPAPAPVPLTQAQAWRDSAQWLRNNYQDHHNIASLCDAMVEYGSKQ
jgi:hypothetical protein